MAEIVEAPPDEYVGKRTDSGRSYKAMYDDIFSGEKPIDPSKPVEKPSPRAQADEPTSKRIPFSKVWGTRMRNTFANRKWTTRDKGRAIFFAVLHVLACFAPFHFTWKMFITQFFIYVFSALGITYSYHRQLAHKSFKSKKWFEYLWATIGMMGMQGAPLDWASEHRYHHLHTETPYDPHSIWEGFYWAHTGWLLDSEKKEERCADMSNAMDMQKQWFYRFTSKYYKLLVLLNWSLFYAIGGTAGLVWRAFWVVVQYHVTWCVNSASHLWGGQEYRTFDNSRNNWWVGILAFGEGWHNNHHAFEYSARHGLHRKQIDMTYMAVRLFEALGLVSNVKLPTEKNKNRLRLAPGEKQTVD
jgi:stearoyl-CoA desaturase (delta-9 desaturase)